MRSSFFAIVCSAAFSTICFAQTLATETPSPHTDVENNNADEVLIIGEQPGPSLWKVSKDDHVLWILGGFGPLPTKMQWHSQQAEAALIQSQELLLYPKAEPKIGFFTGLSMLPSLVGIKKNPDGVMLQDAVPPETYARWLVLKEKYIGKNNSIEKYRPIFAGNDLLEQALEKVGLNGGDLALKRVQEIAKKHKIKSTTPTFFFEMKSPKQTLKNFKLAQIDDTACFTKMLDHLEADIDNMRLRANAWAIGDLEALAKLPMTDHNNTCFQAIMNSSFMDGETSLKELPAKMETEWLAAVDRALADNQSTFAIAGTWDILKKDGAMAKLQAKGYRIEGFGFDTTKVE